MILFFFYFVSEQIDPCKGQMCAFGSRCVPSSDGKTSTCRCPDKCPNYGDHTTSRPVCGSNGVDYNGICELNRAACMSNTNITQKFAGKCGRCTMKTFHLHGANQTILFER